jgi:cell division protein FtsA
MRHTIVGLDLGTTKICTVVAQVHERGGAHILGVGTAPSKGFEKGVVVHIDDAAAAIASSIEQAEKQSGVRIDSAYVGVTGSHISSLNSSGAVAIGRSSQEITEDDIARAAHAAEAVIAPSQREVLHVIPRTYTVDDQEGVRNPIGMRGYRLEVQAHLVSGEAMAIQNLLKTVERAGIEIEEFVFQPLAASEGVLKPEERETGVVLVDIGASTTDIAVFLQGSIWHTSVLAVGGNHFTNDLAYILHLPHNQAEEVKRRYGRVVSIEQAVGENQELATEEARKPDEEIQLDASFGSAQTISRTMVEEILSARAEQLIEMIYFEVMRSGISKLPPAGIVLTGGSALLPQFDQLVQEMLGVPVRIGFPTRVTGLTDQVNTPCMATGVGLLRWGSQNGDGETSVMSHQHHHAGPSWFERFKRWLQEFLP